MCDFKNFISTNEAGILLFAIKHVRFITDSAVNQNAVTFAQIILSIRVSGFIFCKHPMEMFAGHFLAVSITAIKNVDLMK